MDDSYELVFMASPEEIRQIEQTDRCVTLYTLWDKLRKRGSLGDRLLYSCRNDSAVPDARFAAFAAPVFDAADVLVDHGEVLVHCSQEEPELRAALALQLQQALESL
jgi:hypothetical protein